MNGNKCTPEALACLPREELRRMLTEELHKNPEQIDDAFVRMLLAELQVRGNDPAFTDDDAIEAACKKFITYSEQIPKPRKRWYQHWMLKVASVVLVLGSLFFALPAVTEAGNVENVLGWWSDSVFRFFSPGKQVQTQTYVYETDHPGLQQIYDTITELGITEQIVPRKLSKEFELTELKTVQMTGDTSIHACLVNEQNNILYTVIVHNKASTLQHEKNKDTVSVWDLTGVEHYVISNTKEQIVTWVVDNIECTVITDCPEKDVYDFIKSIYTLED